MLRSREILPSKDKKGKNVLFVVKEVVPYYDGGRTIGLVGSDGKSFREEKAELLKRIGK